MYSKSKRWFTKLLVFALILSMALAPASAAFAATGNKKVTNSGKLQLILYKGQSGDSNTLSYVVSGLPSNALVTKIEIYTGTLSYTGGMQTNHMKVTGTNKSGTDQVSWGGAGSTTIQSNYFNGTNANGTYTLSFNGTYVGGTLQGGVLLEMCTKTYTAPYITVFYSY